MGPSLRALCTIAVLAQVLSTATARAEAPNEGIGTSPTALPGLSRVAAAGTLRPGFALALSSGYGYTESVLKSNESHHRALGGLALSYRPVEAFAVALRLDGRFDSHSRDPVTQESDDGWVGDPRLVLRWGTDVSDTFRFGVQATAWFPGKDAPSFVGSATSADALALASVQPGGGPSTLHFNAGFRLDNSAKAIDDPNVLSPSDRLALGLSDSNAVLLGAGWEMRMGKVAILAEATWDILVGGDAPSPIESPLRVGAGVRAALTDTLAFQADLAADAGSRPNLDPMDAMAETALIPVEPRVTLLAALTYRPAEEITTVAGGGDDKLEPPPPKVEPGKLKGFVKTADGAPVPGAQVKVGDAEITSAADGSFAVDNLPAGSVAVTVKAEGYKDASTTSVVNAGQTTNVNLVVERNLPAGELRGLVQSYGGQPLQATIKIQPGGQTIQTSATGEFEVDLAPGEYTITIGAPGHQEQQAKVKIELNGVTVKNVDLRKQ